MKYPKIYIEKFENNTNDAVVLHDIIRVQPGARIVRSTFNGPLNMERISLIGPDFDDREIYQPQSGHLHHPHHCRRLLRHWRAIGYQSVQPSDRLVQHSRIPVSPDFLRLGAGIQ